MNSTNRILILCFSPSGCCADLADAANTVLEHDGYDVIEYDITDPEDREAILQHSIKTDLLLLICPVYHRRIPTIVTDFFRRFKLSAKRADLILGYGSCGVGKAPKQARKMLSKIGIRLYRVMKYPTKHAYNFAVKTEQQIDDGLEGLAFFLRNIAAETSTALPELYGEPDPLSLFSLPAITRMAAKIPVTDMNLCTMCDRCSAVCPSGALAKNSGIPDPALCIRCGECVRICSEGAKSMKISPIMKFVMKQNFRIPAYPLELSERK